MGPQHEVLHRALSHAWRPAPVVPYGSALVRPLLVERLASLADRPMLELFRDVASIVTISVIAGVLGLEDRYKTTLHQATTWLDEPVVAWRHTFCEDPALRAAAVAATRTLEPALRDVQPDPAYLGFVSRAWRPLHLRHAVRTTDEVRRGILGTAS